MVLLDNNLGITLTEAMVLEHPTIEDLACYFLTTLFEQQTLSMPVTTSTLTPVIAEASDTAWEELLQDVAELSEDELLQELQSDI